MLDKIKEASTESLIQFLAVHQALKINKEMTIQIMLELDKRRENGEVLDLDRIDLLSNLIKSVGSGFIIKVIPSQIYNIQKTLTEKNITTIKISLEQLFVGKITEETKTEILDVVGVLEISEDKDLINATFSSRIPEVWEIFRGFSR